LLNWDVSAINSNYNQELDQIGSFLQSHPEAFAVIDGYSDNTGAVDYNLRLPRKRAENVASYLANKFGISSERLVGLWYGQANPTASNDTDEGRAQNRRVEIANWSNYLNLPPVGEKDSYICSFFPERRVN